MAFNFRFENTNFFTQDLNSNFKDKEDVIEYFKDFREEYDSFYKKYREDFRNRMKGEEVKNYSKIHNYSVKLEDHYKLLLTIGTNGFDIFLNNYINE